MPRTSLSIWMLLFSASLCFGPAMAAWGAEPEPAASSTPKPTAEELAEIDFNSDIRPILSDHCFACHGPDEAERQGGLRLDQAESAFAEADSGEPAIVPRDVEASPLVARIRATEPYEMMPPPEANKPLSEAQKVLLERWIEGGAPYAAHWSFVPPVRHEPPPSDAPPSELDAATSSATDPPDPIDPADPIDGFILAKLRKAGLTAAGPADREALLRRVTFDLTGLPPTPGELDAFLADDSPEAYERVVDRLLQSPRYGEHMARFWLDLVRYGDTHGLHLDNYREMWPYRDWVIAAFNDNKSFDAFVTEQLAGDLLPDATLADQIASGFNRLNVTTSEGGSIYEEVFARNVTDRTDAFGTVFLGLTTGCAVCHDHKFDPISQREFYSLSAFFNSLDGKALDGNVKDHPPVAQVPSEQHLQQLAEVDAMRADLEKEMNGPLPAVDEAEQAWAARLTNRESATTTEWIPLVPEKATSSGESTQEILADGAVRAGGELPAKEALTIEGTLPSGGPYQLIRLEALTEKGDEPAGRAENGNAVLSEIEVAVRPSDSEGDFLPVRLIYGEADHEQPDSPKFALSYAIDGKVEADAGWAIGGHQKPGPRSAWFVADSLLGSPDRETQFRVTLKYESQYAGHAFKQVRLAVSSDLPLASPERQLKLGPWHQVGPFEVENAATGYYREFASQSRAFQADEKFTYQEKEFQWKALEDFQPTAVHELPTVADRSSVMLLHRRITAATPQKLTVLLGTEDGVQVWLGGKKVAESSGERGMIPLGDEITVDLKQGDNDLYIKTINHEGPAAFAVAFRSPSAPLPEAIGEIAAKPPAERTDTEAKTLRDYYRRVVTLHPDWLVLQDMVQGLRKRRDEILATVPTTLVWRELETPRTAHVLIRGEYDKPGEAVSRGVPASLPPMAEEMPRNRLGLAQWLTAPEHPLTARVAVNRFWQQLFGTGLVKTSEDFGAQGTPPSHPQLLDTLAVDFREGGWNVKQLLKRLVMTDAYRRTAVATPEMLAKDPANRLLARGPRFRLDGEMLRDQALFVSGQLVEKLGGPSVKPPQPKGLWSAVGYSGSNTVRFVPDEGEKIYRRSLYTFWKRTSPPPQMTTFDAPSRESCTARRERTNTPMQALLLMNEPQYVEAAKGLAREAAEAAGSDEAEQIRWAFKAVLSRAPDASELEELQTLRRDAEQLYAAEPELTEALGVDSPAAAAETIVASTILNLDAALNK
ncbi:PSD1 and planctomycete cytochrome C domain-containing protein [Candidatus Laterigemmans baculatus]|uniref:PSD1 and planctomycete cytochrome C domain-containing protein n=1 Tax=Candidatus Laterigemmans baculatus TaxID=2770505 RepID=UPI0013D91679|nr:PSD1 and planctomycete cytochrome C domain-containing protein [Candidatus Laterigemmans baculatus]